MNKFLRVIFLYLNIAYKIYWTNRRRTNKLIKELQQKLAREGNSLSDFQVTRIEVNTIFSCVTNQWFSKLRGSRPDEDEQKIALFWGALVPLIDDLTDEKRLSTQEILSELTGNHPTNSNTVIAARYLIKKFPSYFIGTLINSTQFILEAQEASIKQLAEEKIGNDALKQITYSKGSHAALLYRMVLKNPLEDGEKEAIYTLGYLLQLTNDLFDVYKDFQNRQQTLYTNTFDFQILYHEYEEVYQRMCNQSLVLDYELKNIKKFLFEVAVIKARAMVCFDQLLLVQKENNSMVELNKFSRKQLVCDMEKSSNIIRSIKYSFQLYEEMEALIHQVRSVKGC